MQKCLAEYDRVKNWKIKLETLAAYGGICTCCGENNPKFLALDHINKDGAQKRRSGEHGKGTNFYLFLRRLNYPDVGLRVLCYNCNMATFIYGVYPHEEEQWKKSQLVSRSTEMSLMSGGLS